MRRRVALTAILAFPLAMLQPVPAMADTPPQFVGVFHGPALADMYPVDVSSSVSSYFVLDAGRYRVVEVDRVTGTIVDEFGGHQGRSTTRIGAARAIARDDAGNIYIADTASNRLVKLDPNLSFMAQTGSKGTGAGQFTQDYGVALGPGVGAGGQDDEVVYVTDGTPGRVQVFTRSLTYLRSFGQGVIDKPRQLTVDPSTEFVYVISAAPKRIDVFNRNGVFKFSFGSKGQGTNQFTQDPRGVALYGGFAFVSDPGKDRVQVWDVSSGTNAVHECNFTGGGVLADVRGISITDDGRLIAADEWDFALEEFDISGIGSGCAAVDHLRQLFGEAPGVGVNSPRGLDVSDAGKVYISDWWNQQIDRRDGDGTNPMSWGFRGTPQEPGSINFAWDVAVQPNTGYVFVANRESNEIEAFDANGTFLGRDGKLGSGVGQFRFPQGLAFGNAGNLYVADTSNNRIQRCTVDLDVPTKTLALGCTVYAGAGAPGTTTFKVPTGVDVGADGSIWVADTQNNRIQRRSPSTGEWTSIGTPSGGTKFKLPWGVTVAPDGHVWVSDSGNDRIVRMTPAGAQVYAFTGTDVGAGAFDAPFDVAFWGTQILVSDTWNNRVIILE